MAATAAGARDVMSRATGMFIIIIFIFYITLMFILGKSTYE
jgi:preprotein translocase subunit SecG